MLATVSPVRLIETHFGNLRDPRALHSILHGCDLDLIPYIQQGKSKIKYLNKEVKEPAVLNSKSSK